MTELTVKELKQKIIDGGITEEQIDTTFEELKETGFLYRTPNGLRMALFKIAKDNKIAIEESSAGAVGEVFPMKIEEAYDTDKKNMTVSGYPVSGFRLTDKGHIILTLADDTGKISIGFWEGNNTPEKLEQFVDENNVTELTYIEVKNISWSDKSFPMPSFGDYSALEVVEEAPFPIIEAKTLSTANAKSSQYGGAMVGAVVSIDPTQMRNPKFCGECNKWFKGATDDEVGEMKHCETCGEVQEVMTAIAGTFTFGDRDGFITVEISQFAGIQSLEEGEEILVRGKWLDKDKEGNPKNVFVAYQLIRTKKKI